jgi:hypothetical protein
MPICSRREGKGWEGNSDIFLGLETVACIQSAEEGASTYRSQLTKEEDQ